MVEEFTQQVKAVFHQYKILFLIDFALGLGLGVWLGSM